MNRLSQISTAMVLGATLTLGATSAWAGSKSGLNTFEFGNSYAGAKGTYRIDVENRTGYSKTAITATGNVKFLNQSVKGVEFNATVENASGTKRATYALSVAGYTVDSGTKTASYTWSKSVNKTLVSASLPLMVGPVPVTISGSVGGGAGIGCTLALNTSGVGLSGSAAAWANGSASAGVGVTVLNLALRSDLQLGKTSFNPSVQVTPTTMTGKADLVFDPVKIDFSVALQTMGKVLYSQLLASYSAPSRTVALLRL